MKSFIGSQAIANGELTRGQLRWNYVAIAPDVYVPKEARRDVLTLAGAWSLWAGGTGIVAGRAAAALHGVKTPEWNPPVELISSRSRSLRGVLVRRERIQSDEVCEIANLPVTSPARTALDLARRLPRGEAVALLDQLAAATGVTHSDVEPLLTRHSGVRGVTQARMAVADMDGGTRSPAETEIRLWLTGSSFPAVTTGITLVDGERFAAIGMGWPALKVGVSAYAEDDLNDRLWAVRRQEVIQRFGWIEIVALPNEPKMSLLYRVRRARRERGAVC